MRLEKSQELDNLYKLFGICAHHCSNIEYTVAFLLHPAKWRKHDTNLETKIQKMQNKLNNIKEWNFAKKEFDEALDKVQQDIDKLYNVPLGNLIKQINDNYPLSDKAKEYLKKILDKRNYVIHKMWGAYGRRLKDPSVIKEMLNELQDCEAYLRTASEWLKKQAYLLNDIAEEIRKKNSQTGSA